jgi:hypothetical protein
MEDPQPSITSLDDFRRNAGFGWHNAQTSPIPLHPKFRFSHDMESFVWVALHVLARCRRPYNQTNDKKYSQFFKSVYSAFSVPTKERESIITMTQDEFAIWAHDHIIPSMVTFVQYLAPLRKELRRSYLNPGLVNDMANAASYGSIYDNAIFAIRILMDLEIPHDVLLKPTLDWEPSLQPEDQKKRSRPEEQPGHQRKRPRPSDSVEYYPTDAVKDLPRRN